ncbi:nuclear transport factor 2 family protein, partial [Streptomyces mirabilis]|uniref:nuclear transport factor 2 family protein n=1 Tax=Streptomyces mirabilis TaxID=68239 RepID=UPI0037AE53E3
GMEKAAYGVAGNEVQLLGLGDEDLLDIGEVGAAVRLVVDPLETDQESVLTVEAREVGASPQGREVSVFAGPASTLGVRGENTTELVGTGSRPRQLVREELRCGFILSCRLADIEDIRQLKARYFRYIDSKQWSKLATLFTAHPTIDVGAKYSSGKELAEKTAALLGDAPSAHQGFLPEIKVNGTRASAIWAMEDYVSFPPGSTYKNGFHGYGEYHDTYKRINGHWYIDSTVLSRFRVDTVPNWTPAPTAPKK